MGNLEDWPNAIPGPARAIVSKRHSGLEYLAVLVRPKGELGDRGGNGRRKRLREGHCAGKLGGLRRGAWVGKIMLDRSR